MSKFGSWLFHTLTVAAGIYVAVKYPAAMPVVTPILIGASGVAPSPVAKTKEPDNTIVQPPAFK